MNTTSVIVLVGVLGVGGVGAYMFLKNKKAQEALLSGSLPATNQGGGFVNTPTTSGTTTSGTTTSGTTTSGTTTSGTTPSGTAPQLSTTSDGVSPSDANINLANATILVAERAVLQAKIKAPIPTSSGVPTGGGFAFGNSEATKARAKALSLRELAKKQLVELDAKLAKLGYKVDATGSLVRI
jgi:hypothetical protein